MGLSLQYFALLFLNLCLCLFTSSLSLNPLSNQTLADASNYAGPLCKALRGASLDEEEEKHARKSFRASSSSAAAAAAAAAAASSSDCLPLPAIDEKEVSTEEGGGEEGDASDDDDETDSLRDRLVARQLEVVDALCRALREALEGMERAAAAAARLAYDGAALARDAAPTPSAAAASSGGAVPCAASTAASLADAARAMAATAACARAAAGAVEAGADVGGLRALLRTLRGERRKKSVFFSFFLFDFSVFFLSAFVAHEREKKRTPQTRLASTRTTSLTRWTSCSRRSPARVEKKRTKGGEFIFFLFFSLFLSHRPVLPFSSCVATLVLLQSAPPPAFQMRTHINLLRQHALPSAHAVHALSRPLV